MKKLFSVLFVVLVFNCHDTFAQDINFTFHNGSLQSISLEIPSVMNPNLNPLSNSGITLKIGQNVYFYPNGRSKKRALLFTVDETFVQNQVLEIDELIDKRKKELKEE
ncbi:MAG: hypothetical protein RL108_182 [Bacteroidota bacterium]|jgi:hypothetical protein